MLLPMDRGCIDPETEPSGWLGMILSRPTASANFNHAFFYGNLLCLLWLGAIRVQSRNDRVRHSAELDLATTRASDLLKAVLVQEGAHELWRPRCVKHTWGIDATEFLRLDVSTSHTQNKPSVPPARGFRRGHHVH